jgi:fructose-bisphosphate aldolase class I
MSIQSPLKLQANQAVFTSKYQTMCGTLKTLFADNKGILAMDESNNTCNEHFASVSVSPTESARRDWRELIITAPGLRECISGVILYDETIRQHKLDGKLFTQVLQDAGILIGIKVDKGAKNMAGHPGEKVTEGLDGLRERLAEYSAMGARFAKWRAVFHISPSLPSRACMDANSMALARYASLCQEAGIVAIVEPEVLMDGDHTLAHCYNATEQVLERLFEHLEQQNVRLDCLILKPNMILPGLTCEHQPSLKDVSEATLRCLRLNVPSAMGGIAFLSGGQSPQLASARLNDMAIHFQQSLLAWPISFSFARAIQQPALSLWHGEAGNTSAAQHALFHRAQCDQAARRGQYTPEMERV